MKKYFLFACCALLGMLYSHAQVIIYMDCNYSGRSSYLREGSYPNGAQFNLPESNISSIEVAPGYQVQFFKDTYFNGSSFTINTSVRCLPRDWNDKIRSLRVLRYEDGSSHTGTDEVLTIFSGCHFGGRSFRLATGTYNDLKSQIGGLPLSSLQMPNGLVLELYSGYGLSGNLLARFSSSQSCFSYSIQQTARSARIYKSYGGGSGPNSGSLVKVYERCSYGGRSVSFREGNFSNFNTQLGNRPAGSVYIPEGMVIELYSGPNFTGNFIGHFTRSIECNNYADRFAKSARIYYMGNENPEWTQPVVSVFTACNYGGSRRELEKGNFPNLAAANIYRVSSLRLEPGFGIEFFSKTSFMGSSSGIITSNNACVSDYWKQNAKSARVIKLEGNQGSGGGNYNGRLPRIFSDCNFRGSSRELREGRYVIGVYGNNSIAFNPTSFAIPAGYQIELYNSASYNGASALLRDNTDCLGEYWRNNTKAIIIRRTNTGIMPVDQ